MTSDDDSDGDPHLLSGGLTMPSNRRIMVEKLPKEPRVIVSVDSSSDSDDEVQLIPSISKSKHGPLHSGLQAAAKAPNMDEGKLLDDSSSDGFESHLAQRIARKIELRRSYSSLGHLMRDTLSTNSDSGSCYKPNERISSSQETTKSIEQKVKQLQMTYHKTISSPAESSSDEEVDLMQHITSIQQRKTGFATSYTSLDSDSDSDNSLFTLSQESFNNLHRLPARPMSRGVKELYKKSNLKHDMKKVKENFRSEILKAKEREKEQRRQQREAKQIAIQAEKENRKRRRLESDQIRGKLANEEIVVLMEHELVNHNELTLYQDMQEAGFLVHNFPSGLGCDVIQFVRLDFVKGGAARAVEMLESSEREEYQHLPIVGVVFHDPMDFISRIERDLHDENDDYPKLESFLKELEIDWRAAWKLSHDCRPRIIFYLNNVNETLDKLWVKSRRKDQSMKPPPTGEELQDSLIWLSVQFCVDCIHYSCAEDLSTQLTKMAVWLAREPYQRPMTDLECTKKTKMQCSDLDLPLMRSQDCWRRQLCQVPGISESMASAVVSYFPTMRSLYLRYQDPALTENQKILLLSDCFGREGRKNVKCSDAVYRILTSKNPNELI